MKWLLLGIVVALAGCAAREPEVRTVRVEVPVQVPCRTQEVPVPAWATNSLKKTDSLELKVRALLAERRQRLGYERLCWPQLMRVAERAESIAIFVGGLYAGRIADV